MPIEFRCPGCSKLLRTPDESAGKKAKCPQCGNIVDVPISTSGGSMEAGPTVPSDFGSEQFPSFPSDSAGSIAQPPKPLPPGAANPYVTPTSPGSLNPYATPTSAETVYGTRAHENVEEGPRTGLPWEREPKSAKSFWETCKLIFGSPVEAFGLMFRTGGLGAPIGFLMIGGLIGGLFSGTYSTLMQLGLLTFVTAAGGQNGPGNIAGVEMIQVAIQLPVALLGGTIGALIGSFISAGIYHLFLMMLGGARFGYETTYRCVAYVNGTVALLQVIPMCGQYAWGIVALIYSILALSAAHRISGGKAAAAVLLPIGLCCGAAIAAFIGIGVFTAIAAS